MKKFIIILFIILSGLGIYFLTDKAVSGNVDSSSPLINGPFDGNLSAMELSHERSSYATLLSLDETGNTSISEHLAGMAAPDAGYFKGKFYSFFPPGTATLGLPFYILGKKFGQSLFFAYFSVALIGIFALVILYFIARNIFKLPVWTSLFVTFCVGFASPFLNFAITFYQHVPTVFFLLLGFYSAWKYKQGHGWWWAAISWSTYGLASFFDYPNLFLLLPVVFYLIYSGINISNTDNEYKIKVKTSLILTSIFLVVIGVGHMYYNYVEFGNFRQFSNTLPEYNPQTATGTLQALQSQSGDTVVQLKNAISFSFSEYRIFNGLRVLYVDIDKSLLLHMPMFILGLSGIFLFRKKLNAEYLTLIAIILVDTLVYASFFDPWGGWGYGPRYLTPSIPVFALFAGVWISQPTRFMFLKKLLAYILFVYGAGVALLGAATKNYLTPNIEATYLNLPYRFWSDFRFLKLGRNGGFAFNTIVHKYLTLTQFYILLLGLVSLLGFIIIFVVSYFEKAPNDHSIDR